MSRIKAAALGSTGALITLAALLADLVLPSSKPGFGAAQAAAAVLGGAVCLVAFRGGRRFIWHDLPIILANTVLLLLVLEAGALLALKFMAGRPPSPAPDRFVPETGEEQPFTPPPSSFHPFVGLRLEPRHRAPGVNTDSLGFRVTPGGASGDALLIHMYGGSTVYGWFLPDSLTIPALLQRELRERLGRPVNVANRSSATRNSTQSMIEFLLALQVGDIPDAAVFYEGYNDAATAWYEGDPGSVLGNRRTLRLFTRGRAAPVDSRRPALMVLAGLLARGGSGAPALIPESDPLGRRADPRELAEETLRVFQSNCRQIRAMAEAYDIPVTILWQPTLAGESRELHGNEAAFRDAMDQGEVRLQGLAWELAQERAAAGLFTWAGDAAAEAEMAVYVDYCHMNGYGHRLVAGNIASRLVLRVEPPEEAPDDP